MFILDFFLAVFALAPFGLLVLFWKAFHEDRGVHTIYRNSKTETTNKNRDPGHYPNPSESDPMTATGLGRTPSACSDHGCSMKF
jgi:hypothetical protein